VDYDSENLKAGLQELQKSDASWRTDYRNYWTAFVTPQIEALEGFPNCLSLPGDLRCTVAEFRQQRRDFYASETVTDLLPGFHAEARIAAESPGQLDPDAVEYFEPGTVRFQEAFDSITTNLVGQGGTQTLISC